MVFSIVKQSVDIRLRLALEKTPKLSADTECAVSIGMLAKMAGLAIPERKETLEEMVADLKNRRRRWQILLLSPRPPSQVTGCSD